jgi:hypothetical protein
MWRMARKIATGQVCIVLIVFDVEDVHGSQVGTYDGGGSFSTVQ